MKTTFAFNLRGFLFTAAFLAALGCASHASAQAYLIDLNSRTATDLGTLGGKNFFPLAAINDAGQVVGSSATAEGDDHAFITGPNGAGMRDLGDGIASGINAAGQVVGWSGDRSFITGPDGAGMLYLGTLGGRYTKAYGINDAGQVVGSSATASGQQHNFITGPNGFGMRDLGTGGDRIGSSSINNAGQVVGSSGHRSFITGPDGVGIKDLGTLGGNFSFATGINDTGQVVGWSAPAEGGYHAFITGPNGVGMRDLGTLGGGDSFAYGINDAGQVVGYSYTPEGFRHAFITGPNGVGMTDLNSLVDLPAGLVLAEARDINNAGQVVVIPEPESYALLLAGLALIGVVAWRKKDIDPFPARMS
jgi:probable HAF family extracellular repeat protein